MSIYIKSTESISPQETFDTDQFLSQKTEKEEAYFTNVKPNYKDHFNPKILRRMSSIVRAGVVTTKVCLEKAGVEKPDAILIGTSLGCVEDTVKFLTQMIEFKEELLNPTAFIQSTHNTVSGKIALMLGCNSHNLTFSQRTTSFETALIDAQLMFWDKKADNVLVGGTDEITPESFAMLEKAGCTKLYTPGEGTTFFVLSNQSAEQGSVELKGVDIINKPKVDFSMLLANYGLKIENIDFVVGGEANKVEKGYQIAKEVFKDAVYVTYKHLTGEYDTASAFALWIGAKILEHNQIPELLNPTQPAKENLKLGLIYHTRGNEHSIMIVGI